MRKAPNQRISRSTELGLQSDLPKYIVIFLSSYHVNEKCKNRCFTYKKDCIETKIAVRKTNIQEHW